ncbi:SDR family NAD(P)-dependent oxidoreductase [Paractinoplanes brasiliensis]|uniref:NAD(P)-dependent dehydrogenase (Short-subunit alcohol dehydrogenase family) n=1 Tax=Paractinoplanes brasiliensis TaxID=52695 RepID=A0A4R6JBG9_9ACTN|nr:SDR family oxidoreductase [Actinoplanes brasiliensis]TDO33074.1 NAD(P)-dependent dehydrogenase (short-subunit alcohol dehydrogenase family) [Actinoplanes brasiliensis]GID28795.1 3-oxoacyl-ACP reductase [Actinoplanes brasiliensis]
MDIGLSGKNVIVTGASRGIGLAVTRALAAEGASVTAVSKGGSAELKALGVESFLADLTDPQAPAAVVAAVPEVDVLVNNVGAVRPRTGGFLSVSDEDWAATLGINLLTAVRMTRAVLPRMLERGSGSIVTVSSVNAVLPDPLVIDYSAAKAALSSFCKSLSKEYGPAGIRVNTVSPGPVATALWLGEGGVAATVASATGGDPQAVAAQAAGDSVTGRFTRPDEVAALVTFLAGNQAANITGSDFPIDGGLVTTL